MGRPSNRDERRAEIVQAFALVLAEHGYAGATVSHIAVAAGISPGLIHHHFKNKEELLDALLSTLMGRFQVRLRAMREEGAAESDLFAYADAALRLDARADTVAARCWVGLFAEAVRNPQLFQRVRRMMDGQVAQIRELSRGQLDDHEASAVLSFVVGSLVFGAFAPRKVAGFAAPALREFLVALGAGSEP